MSDQVTAPDVPVSTWSIARAAALAFAAAVVVLVTIVLPAEFSIDPLGTGRLLGLTQLRAQPAPILPVTAAPEGPLAPQPVDYKMDTVEFSLLPQVGFVEYHYRLPKGAPMVYSWKATGKVLVDFHAQQDGAPPDVADTFEKGEMTEGRGAYTAPYPGLHGWYWENRTNAVVRITVTSAGFYTAATEFRDDGTSVPHELRPVPVSSQ